MAIDNLSSFKKMLNDKHNEDLKFRAQEVAAGYIAEAAQRGIQMTLDEAYGLSAVRLHIMTGERVTEEWWAEAEQKLDAFAEARREAELMRAVQDKKDTRHADAVAELNAQLEKMTPADRMSHARKLGQRLPGPKTGDAPKSAPTARDLEDLERLSGAMRMSRYRELFG